jgi:hypothetical protein
VILEVMMLEKMKKYLIYVNVFVGAMLNIVGHGLKMKNKDIKNNFVISNNRLYG